MLDVFIKAQTFQIYIQCMHILSLFSLSLQFYEHKNAPRMLVFIDIKITTRTDKLLMIKRHRKYIIC